MCCINLDIVSTTDMKCSSSFLFVQVIDTAERCICLTRDVQTSLSLSMASTISKVTKITCSGIFSWVEMVAVIKLFVMRTFYWFISGEDANCQRQEQSSGAWASRSPSPSQGSHTGAREKENRHRCQRGRLDHLDIIRDIIGIDMGGL